MTVWWRGRCLASGWRQLVGSSFSITALSLSLAAGVGSLLWLCVLQASQGQLHEERLFSEGEY